MKPLKQICWPLHFLLLTACCLYIIYSMTGSVLYGFAQFDTLNTYLPLAEAFKADPLATLASEKAITVAPGSYIYMSLLGADIDSVSRFNIALACVSVIIIFDLVRRISNVQSGICAAALYALSPLMNEVRVPVLSEPPYLFFMLAWLWGMVMIYQYPYKKILPVLTGLALLISILTRPLFFYWIPAVIVLCTGLYYILRDRNLQQFIKMILIAHLIAAVGAAIFILQNHRQHGVAMISTGSATALYFGTNPVTHGYEPPYVGLIHDEWMVTDRVHSHLTPHNEARIKFAALEAISDSGLGKLAQLSVKKLGANLFFSKAHLENNVLNERALRIVLITLALVGTFIYRRNPAVILLFLVTSYSVAILIPAMYNQRYSIGSMELPLIILAGIGLGGLINSHIRYSVVAVVLMLTGITIGSLHQRYSYPLMPDTNNQHIVPAAIANYQDLVFEGFSKNPLDNLSRLNQKNAKLTWNNVVAERRGGIPIIQIEFSALDKRCKNLTYIYNSPGNAQQSGFINIRGMNYSGAVNFGTLFMNSLRPSNGNLQVIFDCPAGSEIRIDSIGLYLHQAGLHYRSLLSQNTIQAEK